jgi:DnaJ like chaperone protein
MGWFGKIALGSLGMLLGGPLGAIAGTALGHMLIDKKVDLARQNYGHGQIPPPEFGQAERAQAAFFVSLFSVLGKISKIDGVVDREEINVVQAFINGLPIEETEKQFARQVFNEAKSSPYRIEDFAAQLYRTVSGRPELVHAYFDLLLRIVAADGSFHPAEEEAIKRVRATFGISEQQYEDMKAVYFDGLDKHYKTLDCTPECSIDDIKRNYKKLVKEFHPDVIISKGLPEEFVEFASNRFREIQESYEKIKRERNF